MVKLSTSSSSSRTAFAWTVAAVSTFSLFSNVDAQGTRTLAKHEPADGKLILSGWLLQDPYPEGLDSPKAFNDRIGYHAGAFQLAQSMPLDNDPFNPGKKIIAELSDLNDGTDASLFMTICEWLIILKDIHPY
jgi:hypothetical protein